jgi:hypothetical protein
VRLWGNALIIKDNFGFWMPELLKNCGFWTVNHAQWCVSRSEWFLSHTQWCVSRPEKEGGDGKSSSCTLVLGTASGVIDVVGDEVVDILTVLFDLRPNVFALRTIVLDKSSELVGYGDRVVGYIDRDEELKI